MITLRELLMKDAKPMAEALQDREIFKYTERIPYPYSLKNAMEFIERARNGGDVIRAIEVDGEFAGIISLSNIFRGRGELGYWLARRFWGKGIMTEAVGMFLKEIKGKVDLVYAFVAVENIASVRVLEKNGFKRAGIVRKFTRNPFGEKFDAYIYFKEI